LPTGIELYLRLFLRLKKIIISNVFLNTFINMEFIAVMFEENLIKSLTNFGMSEREAKIYLALLASPESSASDLQRVSGVVRSKIYEILHQMVARGYCIDRVEGRNRFYNAVDPKVLLDIAKSNLDESKSRKDKDIDDLKKEFNEKQQLLTDSYNHKLQEIKTSFKFSEEKIDLKNRLAEKKIKKEYEKHEAQHSVLNSSLDELGKIFSQNYSTKSSLDFVEVIRHKEQIHRTYIQLVLEAKKEILAFSRPPYSMISEAQRAEQIEAQLTFLNREGTRQQGIILKTPDNRNDIIQQLSVESPENDVMRVCSYLPTKLFIFDRNKVLLATPIVSNLARTDFTMVVIDEPGFAELCVKGFEYYWEISTTREQFLAET
jgi:HTH-type transcriptional regulator, sugar sensing transcriptional regulator